MTDRFVTVLTKPVAWQGRVVVWMALLAVALFAGNQWLRLRGEIASGVVSIAGRSWPTRPVRSEEVTKIARQPVVRAPIEEAVRVRPLKLTEKQETAVEAKFDLRLKDTDVAVVGVFKTPPAPRGSEVVVTVSPEGIPEVVSKALPPRFFELGPWVVDASVVQELADVPVQFGRLAVSKDLRIGKVWSFARANYDFGRDRSLEGEVGLRLKF